MDSQEFFFSLLVLTVVFIKHFMPYLAQSQHTKNVSCFIDQFAIVSV